MISDFSGLINPYLMNYGSYGSYGGYGNYGSFASRIGNGQRGTNATGQGYIRKDHTLSINSSDSVATKAMKEAINRVNAAGNKPQNARGATKANTEAESRDEKWSDLNKALKKMDADDIRELYTMMRTAFEGFGSGGLY